MPDWKRRRLQGIKRCWDCKTDQPPSNFHRSRREWDGLNRRCKSCAAKVKDAAYLARTKERRAATQKAWNERHPGRTTEIMREWRARNPERSKELGRLWQQAHLEIFRDRARRRRAMQRSVPHELVERSVVWERDGGICGICHLPADLNDWHLDHVVPLVKGGPHTYANTQVSHPLCNMRKSDGGHRKRIA